MKGLHPSKITKAWLQPSLSWHHFGIARSICYSRFEMNIARYLIIAAIAFFAVPFVGCGEQLNLREVTTKAITATCEAQSYRTSAVQTYTVNGESGESTYESEFVAPDRYHSKTRSGNNWSETIFIGDKSYIRSTDIPQWCESPCQYYDPVSGAKTTAEATLIPLEKELKPLNWLSELEKLPDEESDGVACWHYRSRVDMDSYVDEMLTKREGSQVPPEVTEALENMRRWTRNIELRVEKDSYLIRQLKEDVRYTMVDPDTGEEKLVTESVTMRFHDFNKPISIEPPQM